jgi:hypothetical protein
VGFERLAFAAETKRQNVLHFFDQPAVKHLQAPAKKVDYAQTKNSKIEPYKRQKTK